MGQSQEQVDELVREFISENFADDVPQHREGNEAASQEAVLDYVEERFSGMKYILGLAIDFVCLAQRLSAWDAEAKTARPDLTEDELFARYELVTSRGRRTANTLTVSYEGNQVGIRKTEEKVVQLFHSLNRSGYPSAYVYNTGQWHKYKDLLVDCFKLSEAARLSLLKKLIAYGMETIAENPFFGREVPRVRLYEEAIRDFPRSSPGENGGLTFQAMAYGYAAADRPHLSIIADKVRTGSARQRRFGDVDCYSGLDIELSIEVKDIEITSRNKNRELGSFIKEVATNRIRGMAFVASVDEAVREELDAEGVYCLTEEELLATVETWDWSKQNAAVLGMLHYLSHIEQNAEATLRLLRFVEENDPQHDSLCYLSEEEA